MPRLVSDAGDAAFAGRVAQDEPIFPAVFHQPFLLWCMLLCFVQKLMIRCHNVYGKPELMLAGTGRGYPLGGLLLSHGLRISLGQKFLYLIFMQLFLLCTGAIG